MAEGDRREVARVEWKSLGAQQDDAIAALLRAPGIEQAAALAGTSVDTLREWMKSPQFSAKYRAARQEGIDAAVARLEQLADGAVEALARNLTCGDPAVEVEAARVILERGVMPVQRHGMEEQSSERGFARGDHPVVNGRLGW